MQLTIEPFMDGQINSIIELIKQLKTDLPNIKYLSGHQDLDVSWVPASDDQTNCTLVRGKVDPGVMFPWDRVLKAVAMNRYQPNGDVGDVLREAKMILGSTNAKKCMQKCGYNNIKLDAIFYACNFKCYDFIKKNRKKF